jgi:hypothetical protein
MQMLQNSEMCKILGKNARQIFFFGPCITGIPFDDFDDARSDGDDFVKICLHAEAFPIDLADVHDSSKALALSWRYLNLKLSRVKAFFDICEPKLFVFLKLCSFAGTIRMIVREERERVRKEVTTVLAAIR